MKILLGVTGSISAYKAVEIMRLFQKRNHDVGVILTEHARYFITPLTFETFSPGKVFFDQFSEGQDPLLHINLGNEFDLLLVAPATANIIGKMANGIADDLLSTVFTAFPGKVVVAPAMNTRMYASAAVTDNISRLKSRGVGVIEPEEGSLACRTEGRGRLADVEAIIDYCLGIVNV